MTPDERRERQRGYMRQWNAAHPEKRRENGRRWLAANSEYMRQLVRRWRENNPRAVHAHNILNNAIKRGEAVRPDHCSIPGCSNPDPEGHHEDYSKPLDVVWLCVSCHKLLHLRQKEELDMSKITDDEVFSILNNPEIQELAAQINATLAQIHELCKKEDIPTPGLEQLAQDIQGHSGVMLQD